ncbi:MAG: hypothetical protein HGJ94_04680 [Desulfosarcina sp.]|nr:hypothetical protein [Desulfosarcina sp.]
MKHVSRQCGVWYLVLLAAVVAACTTAKPIAEWRNQDYTGGPFDNILIVGVSDQVTVRRAFENTFLDRLQEEKIKATPSFAIIPGETRPTEENIKAVIKDIKFDSVLITHLVGVEEKEVYHPSTYYTAPYYRGFYGYYGHVGSYVYEPEYYSRHKLVKLETNLYDVRTEMLVWSMQSETMNPSSEQKLIDAKIKTVVKRLKAQKLLQAN